MFKGMLTSTSLRLIVLLVFFGVCTGLTWSDTTHSDRYSHIEKVDATHFDAEGRAVKDLCPATTVAAVFFRYSPLVTPLSVDEINFRQSQFLFIPTVGRAPPV